MERPGRVVLAVGQCFACDDDAEQMRAMLAGEGIALHHAADQDMAALWVCEVDLDVVLIDLSLTAGSPLAVADFCNYRRPETRVILIGVGDLMADGSLFGHVGNAAALIPEGMSPRDMSALLSFHANQPLRAA